MKHFITLYQLPNEIIGEILLHTDSVGLILSYRKVCKLWQALCRDIIWRSYKTTISNFKFENSKCDDKNELDEFLRTKCGRYFIKYLMRRQVHGLACNISKMAIIESINNRTIINPIDEQWVNVEIETLKGYFKQFSDLNEKQSLPNISSQKSNGLFDGLLSIVGSFFSNQKPTNDSTITLPKKNIVKKKLDYDILDKVLLDGPSGSGQTSFLMCAMNGNPVTIPNTHNLNTTIGVDFCLKNFNVGPTRIRLQLWDQCGYDRFGTTTAGYYINSSVVLLLIDPFSTDSNTALTIKQHYIKAYAPKAEVMLLSTRKDIEENDINTKVISGAQADLFAFQNFNGGLHLNITNTEVEEPKQIIWYCILLKYLLSNNELQT